MRQRISEILAGKAGGVYTLGPQATVATLRPDTVVEEALRVVNTVCCRHLPVVDDERIVGMISIRDLTNSLVAVREEAIAQLTDYIAGGYGGHAE